MQNYLKSPNWSIIFTIDRTFAGELTLPKAETLDTDDLITLLARLLSRISKAATPASLNRAVSREFPDRALNPEPQSLQTDVLVEFTEDPKQDRIYFARTVLAVMVPEDYEKKYTNFYHLEQAAFPSLVPYSTYRLEDQLPETELRQKVNRLLEDAFGVFQPCCGFPDCRQRIGMVRRADLPDFREELRTAIRDSRNPAFLWSSEDYHLSGNYVLIPYFNVKKWIAETGAASLSQYYQWFSEVKQRPTLPREAKYRAEWKEKLREPVISFNLPAPDQSRFPSWLNH